MRGVKADAAPHRRTVSSSPQGTRASAGLGEEKSRGPREKDLPNRAALRVRRGVYRSHASALLLTAMAGSGCAGEISTAGGPPGSRTALPGGEAPSPAEAVAPSGIARLTRHEYDNVLRDLL